MSDSLDVLGSLADMLMELGQQRAIANQASRTATLEERVKHLEHQLDTVHRVLRELMSRLAKRLGDRRLEDAAAEFRGEENFEPRAAAQEGTVPHKETPETSANKALRCLACGNPIAEDESKCSACGWTYAASDRA
jgi:hypothetical protein